MGAAQVKNAHEDATPPVLPKRRSVLMGADLTKKKGAVLTKEGRSSRQEEIALL